MKRGGFVLLFFTGGRHRGDSQSHHAYVMLKQIGILSVDKRPEPISVALSKCPWSFARWCSTSSHTCCFLLIRILGITRMSPGQARFSSFGARFLKNFQDEFWINWPRISLSLSLNLPFPRELGKAAVLSLELHSIDLLPITSLELEPSYVFCQ